MGLMVTRVAAEGSLGADIAAQILERPAVLRAAGAFAFGLALVPALPGPLFALFGAGLFGLAAFGDAGRRRRTDEERRAVEAARRAAIRRPETALGLIGVDVVGIDFGAELGALLAPPLAERLLDRIGDVRRGLAVEIGLILPGVRLRDDLAREPSSYAIRVRDAVAAEGRLRLDGLLAVADAAVIAGLGGAPVVEPVYGLPACWLAPERRDAAMASGALVFDPISVIGSHLAEAARANAAALLGRQELQTLLEHLRAAVPTLVKEIGSDGIPLALVQRTFELLLRERIWPRDITATLEMLVDAAATTREPRELAEAVRRRLVPAQLRRRGLEALEPLVLTPACEAQLRSWLADGTLAPQPAHAVHLRDRALAYAARVPRERAALLCGSALRAPLAELVARLGLHLASLPTRSFPPNWSCGRRSYSNRSIPAIPPRPARNRCNARRSSVRSRRR